MMFMEHLLCVRHSVKCCARTISFNLLYNGMDVYERVRHLRSLLIKMDSHVGALQKYPFLSNGKQQL